MDVIVVLYLTLTYYVHDELAARIVEGGREGGEGRGGTLSLKPYALNPPTYCAQDELAARIMEAFRLFDTDGDGVVDFQVGGNWI